MQEMHTSIDYISWIIGKVFSIAVLLRSIQRAQAKPATTKRHLCTSSFFLKDPDFRHYINKQELELQTHAREALTHTAERRVGYHKPMLITHVV
jgi:hypothetical protein